MSFLKRGLAIIWGGHLKARKDWNSQELLKLNQVPANLLPATCSGYNNHRHERAVNKVAFPGAQRVISTCSSLIQRLFQFPFVEDGCHYCHGKHGSER